MAEDARALNLFMSNFLPEWIKNQQVIQQRAKESDDLTNYRNRVAGIDEKKTNLMRDEFNWKQDKEWVDDAEKIPVQFRSGYIKAGIGKMKTSDGEAARSALEASTSSEAESLNNLRTYFEPEPWVEPILEAGEPEDPTAKADWFQAQVTRFDFGKSQALALNNTSFSNAIEQSKLSFVNKFASDSRAENARYTLDFLRAKNVVPETNSKMYLELINSGPGGVASVEPILTKHLASEDITRDEALAHTKGKMDLYTQIFKAYGDADIAPPVSLESEFTKIVGQYNTLGGFGDLFQDTSTPKPKAPKTFTQTDVNMISKIIAEEKARRGKSGEPVTRTEVQRFIQENQDFDITQYPSDIRQGKPNVRPAGVWATSGLISKFTRMPQSIRTELAQMGASPTGRKDRTVKVPSEQKMKSIVADVINRSGRSSPFHKRVLAYFDELMQIEIKDIENRAAELPSQSVLGQRVAIRDKYNRVRLYNP